MSGGSAETERSMNLFETVLETHASGLARVAATYEADRSLQEDLFQDILLAVHLSLHKLENPERLRAFIYRIAHNHGVDHVIRRTRQKRRDAAVEPGGAPATPEDEIVTTERSRRLTSAVCRLPLPYRQVVSLLLEDLSYAEIADALALTPTNVGVRVNRAKTMLREMLNEH
ncbi:sigma-70 family RNA polymerase sigma factor [Brevundimonas diminuta]|uniref:RNA polymerase sigma factor n=1 Tax=Brevundimonas diminuta TaxID=293 RepID=UPI0002A43896|nr:sigma-70 family RNA polymerase sigma factor [Brevundimonas diminuta]EKY28494.1 Sigma-70 region 2 [Brevundimonas diminuta 470-4]MCO8019885.1 sigma-70 family RNA polymerase sigma factor [Brevundimonas diminuta]MCO8023160.1 sigma-70 family RNA polymerase sigma factor [Brevundimonas diminuta]